MERRINISDISKWLVFLLSSLSGLSLEAAEDNTSDNFTKDEPQLINEMNLKHIPNISKVNKHIFSKNELIMKYF